MPRPRKNISIDFLEIENILNQGQHLDLKIIAHKHSTCPPVIRRILCEHFGTRVRFKPGRNGGIQWNAPTIQVPIQVPIQHFPAMV
ncbi:MAG: hypothetical protein JW384_00888 [Nitrosomonadaceae bacterium]|nr:hypothetical protein [Nitrosomonadaceae bacterium]